MTVEWRSLLEHIIFQKNSQHSIIDKNMIVKLWITRYECELIGKHLKCEPIFIYDWVICILFVWKCQFLYTWNHFKSKCNVLLPTYKLMSILPPLNRDFLHTLLCRYTCIYVQVPSVHHIESDTDDAPQKMMGPDYLIGLERYMYRIILLHKNLLL